MTTRIRLAVALLVGLMALPATAAAQTPDPALKKEIARLLEMTGAAQMMTQVATMVSGQMLEGLRTNPDIPPRAIDVAKKVLDQELTRIMSNPDGLLAALADVYAKHFSVEDIKGLVAFYSSDLGKKMLATLPVLMQESAAVAQQWMAREMPQIERLLEERLKREGLIKK